MARHNEIKGAYKGFFTPLFETKESLQNCLAGMYTEVSTETVESEGCFLCRK